ncbi:MAG: nucleotide sugar dehydrogenase [Desulfobacterales bacterium]|jgi:UDP-N-acetyl-D-galactosamine dehydrogenase|nr:nucleotide sugar dehydrogenase [Desulfobacterales bacterium]
MVTFESLIKRKDKIAVIGLGYVGLPLAVHLSRHFSVTGYDCKPERINELKNCCDRTLEVTAEELAGIKINFTSDPKELSLCRLIIVAVPTPIDEYKIPDLSPVKNAAATVGKNLTKGSVVVFESTVYPGVTEEICAPIIEAGSGFKYGVDFKMGYSPERMNPGDKVHTIDNIIKVVSGSDDKTAELLSLVYGKIVKAGIHRASSIMVAEAAKVIENTQRDLNIALMNELSMIFNKMGIDTLEVLEAAGTKWNFLPFKPGLVGGHCIGVDPYYLTFKAEALGYHPEIILAGRRINDGMGKYIAEKAVKLLIRAGKQVRGARIAILGLTFKEDVPDLRNTKVVDIVNELKDFGVEVGVHDPLADASEARKYYGIDLEKNIDKLSGADAVIIAVIHRAYRELGLLNIAGLCSDDARIVMDIKGAFRPEEARGINITYWRL